MIVCCVISTSLDKIPALCVVIWIYKEPPVPVCILEPENPQLCGSLNNQNQKNHQSHGYFKTHNEPATLMKQQIEWIDGFLFGLFDFSKKIENHDHVTKQILYILRIMHVNLS
jgi:hypothetical protein